LDEAVENSTPAEPKSAGSDQRYHFNLVLLYLLTEDQYDRGILGHPLIR
jgi:hypothetical protein